MVELLEPFEALTLLITAIGHDVGHPGVNNGFLVTLNSPLAQLYNDRSVLESFHCAAYSQILRRYWYSAFEDTKMRSLMISSILATDMGLHFDYMKKLADVTAKLKENNSIADWDAKTLLEQKSLACSLIIKCADICNVAREYSTAVEWMHVLSDEFARQWTMENELQIKSSLMSPPKQDMASLCKSQTSFMNLFAIPLFQGVAAVMPNMQYTVDQLVTNKAVFENFGREMSAGDQAALLESRSTEVSMKNVSDLDEVPKNDNDQMTFDSGKDDQTICKSLSETDEQERKPRMSVLSLGSMPVSPYTLQAPRGRSASQASSQDRNEDIVTSFESVADFAASDPFNIHQLGECIEVGLVNPGKQRRSETTTEDSTSGPSTNDWASQTNSATGKLPLSPSTRGTSINSQSSHDEALDVPVRIVFPDDSSAATPTNMDSYSRSPDDSGASNTSSIGRAEGETLKKKPMLAGSAPIDIDIDVDTDLDLDLDLDTTVVGPASEDLVSSTATTHRPSISPSRKPLPLKSSLVLGSLDFDSSTPSTPGTTAELDASIHSDIPCLDSVNSTLLNKSPLSLGPLFDGDGYKDRASSPLKRRASSMDPDNRDIEMAAEKLQQQQQQQGEQQTSTTISPNPKQSSFDLPREMSLDPAPMPTPVPNNASTPSSLKEQIKTIRALRDAFVQAPIKVGDICYLVSHRWLGKALAYDDPKAKIEVAEPLGPIDNSDIIDRIYTQPDGSKFVQLKTGASNDAFEMFPANAWDCMIEWYGLADGQIPIVRQAIDLNGENTSDSISFEFHPPVLEIHHLYSLSSSSAAKLSQDLKTAPIFIMRYSSTSYQSLLLDIKSYLSIPKSRKIKLYQVSRPEPFTLGRPTDSSNVDSTLTPPDSPTSSAGVDVANATPTNQTETLAWPSLFVSSATLMKSTRELLHKDLTADPQYNGSSTLAMRSVMGFSVYAVEEKPDQELLPAAGAAARNKKAAKSIRLTGTSPKSSAQTSRRTSPSSAMAGPSTRSHTKLIAKKKHHGAIGLGNLGNTCYMNSALQCVRSVEELSKYFLSGEYHKEINYDNPLAYNGRMANGYGELLKQMYMGNNDAVRPSNFKSVVGHCRPSFAGYAQHDSQEFLGFLLDALQEDLSRVKSKPYIEKPDSTDEMIGDPAAIAKMAEEVWDITRRRDDSVIADLFTGLYKSTLKCPVCKKVSITFDPFNNLTLPLPVDSAWTKTIKFFPLNDIPIEMEVELPTHSTVSALKSFVAERTGVSGCKLICAEEYSGKFFKVFQDSDDVSDIQTKDIIALHEIEMAPTNLAVEQKYVSRLSMEKEAPFDDTRYDCLAVPVIHRFAPTGSKPPKVDNVSPPHFICLTREEAYSEEAIRRKVLEKIATFSSWTTLHRYDSPIDGTSNISAFDDSSSTDDKMVVAKSIESEDDMVDITMGGIEPSSSSDKQKQKAKEVEGKSNPAASDLTKDFPDKLRDFNTQRPLWVDTKCHMDPIMQNLFDLCYFREKGEGGLPSGWSLSNNKAELPHLRDRVKVKTPEADVSEDTEIDSANATEEESASESNSSPQTRMVSESETETTELDVMTSHKPGSKNHVRRGKHGRDKMTRKMLRKAGVKTAKKRFSDVKDTTPPPSVDDGPLIRINEGIVVEWNADSWEVVFGQTGKSNKDTQGAMTFERLELVKDQTLLKKRALRQSRRTRGITLYQCLEEFEKAEVLSEQDMWYCPRCKEHRRASKKFDLWKTPDILICHLKRFSSSGWRRDKLDHKVDFPLEGLDLEKHVLHKESGKKEIYDLIAIDEHYGGLGGGHYTATARNFVDGNWYNFNDSSVSRVRDPTNVSSSAAYLLFYRRRTSGTLGGPRFESIVKGFDAGADADADSNGNNSNNSNGASSSSDDSGDDQGISLHSPQKGLARTQGAAVSGDSGKLLSYQNSLHSSIEDDTQESSTVQDAIGPSWSFSQLNTSSAHSSGSGGISLVGSSQSLAGYRSDDGVAGDSDSEIASDNANGSVSSSATRYQVLNEDHDDDDGDEAMGDDSATPVDLGKHVFRTNGGLEDGPATDIRPENNENV
ncbi:Ubiquitin carboxyl-terminal hydrolase 12 [Ceratocystis platani]|uniref:Phosphodiesterase n=1 Tax=Ceratocystis fimbriata f. sp. platani TaxID=88771 RepID=A0A0F8B344_CERFI|nr:Ubiquitin carboxyl-terminal hydrolase 12 [Ceratocystis platani]